MLRDHLGNTRVTFGDADDNGLVVNSDIKQINSYYPFGLNMEGPWNGASGANKYQFGEKELNTDFGLNWNHLDWRFYDPAVNRFWVVDPLSDVEPSITPYRYAFNNPLIYTDPDGLFEDEAAAKKYAEEHNIKLRPKNFIGMLFTSGSRSNIVKQKDGSYAIENKKEHSSISDDKEFGVTTAVVISTKDIVEKKEIDGGWFGENKTIAIFRDGTEFDITPIAGTAPIPAARIWKGAKMLQELPKLDATRKVHGVLPKVKDLFKYSKEELEVLLNELTISVRMPSSKYIPRLTPSTDEALILQFC